MQSALAISLVAIFSGLSLLHLYWAVSSGDAVQGFVPSEGGRALIQPGPLACVVVAVALAAAAWTSGVRAGLLPSPLPEWIPRLGTWGISAVFGARAIGDFRYVGFFKRVRGSLFARRDSHIYSPLCAGISLLALGLALSSP